MQSGANLASRSTALGPFNLKDIFNNRHWRVLLTLACLAVLAAGTYRQVVPQPLQGGDFIHTFNAAVAVRDGLNPYERAVTWVNGYRAGDPLENQYFYAPTYALLLVPLTYLPYQAALTLWGVCISGLLVLSVYALLRSTGSRPSLLALSALVTAGSLTSAVRSEYFLGQANLFMVAGVCTALWARQGRRFWLAGLCLALAFVTKPMLLVLLLFLLWKREFRLVLTSAIAFAVVFAAPFLRIGSQAFFDLLNLWHFYSNQYLSFSENVGPRGILERLFTVNPYIPPVVIAPAVASVIWFAIAAGIGVISLAVIAPRPFERNVRAILELGAMIAALLLMSPLTESPYFVLLFIPWVGGCLFIWQAGGLRRPAARWTAATLLVLWLLELSPRRTNGEFWHRMGLSPTLEDVLTAVAPALMIVIGSYLLQLRLLQLTGGQPTLQASLQLVRNSPRLALDWLRDLRRFCTGTLNLDSTYQQ